ncbi:hypothetical protein Lepto7376_2065 [[Leptolyngbya] sp. PCC 7376]|uniref:hypothetical protein n=1 Tax=[Leptolyngbya] sp. PCC 7376 TaxID=111781 RepID=UPI00029F340E|nr:hypothetical protein [[Leptolyngbya] sp. PCC 7376]AFY38365.1 hypothetical protein Lepto7376_2065 [[Leptolyngbya] sp. PCC 7376]
MAEVPAALRTAIAAYTEAVNRLAEDPDIVLSLLRQRNEIEQLKQDCGDRSDAVFGELVVADKALKNQRAAIAQCEDLSQWRQTLDIPAQYWWWFLENYADHSLEEAIENYRVSIVTAQANSTTNTLLEVLTSRDQIEQALGKIRRKPKQAIAEIIDLDEQLKTLGLAISYDRKLEDWKENLKPPESHWWWEFTNPLPLLLQTIDRYEQAINAVDATANPQSEQLLEMLQARDSVERAKLGQNPLPTENITKIIRLDDRLKAHAKAIAVDNTLDEWKQSLNIPGTYWWWQLTDPIPLPNQAIDRYEQALRKLEEPPSPTSAELLEVLLARDAVESAESGQKQPPIERLTQIIELDNRLRQQGKLIADDDILDEWKNSLQPKDNWWWRLTEAETPVAQALDRYNKAITTLESTIRPSWEMILEVLLARDIVEEYNSSAVPEAIARQIIDLDQRLKRQRVAIAKGNQLASWRKSLKGGGGEWWWHLKPTLLGGDDDNVSLFDWVWTAAAVGLLGLAATFMTTTTQALVQPVNGAVISDAVQNGTLIAQGAALIAGAGGALTKNGQKAIENVLASLRLPPNWNSRFAFGFSAVIFLGAYGTNVNLPKLGIWYQSRGDQFARQGDYLQALREYRQATKFYRKAAPKAALSLSLGKVYEQLGQLEKAQEQYETGVETENTEATIRLARVMLLQGLQDASWTELMEDTTALHQAGIYLDSALNQLRDFTAANPDNFYLAEERQLLRDAYINYGLFFWAQLDAEHPWVPNLEQYYPVAQYEVGVDEIPEPLLDERALHFSFSAYEAFLKAAEIEATLPTEADGGTAQCYLELASHVEENLRGQARQYTSKPPYEVCYERLVQEPEHNLHDATIMWHTIHIEIPAVLAEDGSPNVYLSEE